MVFPSCSACSRRFPSPIATFRTIAGLVSAVACLAAADRARAAIDVDGLADAEVYADSVTFTVAEEAGFVITAVLDGRPIAVGEPVIVAAPDFHLLHLAKTELATDETEERVVRFIVRDRARGNSEWGLAPWVPRPAIPSSAAEFAAPGVALDLVAPATFPAGRPVPVAARVRDAGGRSLRLNGGVRFDGLPGASVEVRRGWGAGRLEFEPDDGGAAGTLVLAGRIHGAAAPARTVALVAAPAWIDVATDVDADTTWGPDAFVRVPADLEITAGAILTVAAGTVVEFGAGVDLEIAGRLVVAGTPERPVVFTGPADGSRWGGCFARQATSRVEASGAIFAGSGADQDWFSGSGYSAHRDEQATFLFSDDTVGTFTDCVFLGDASQALHGRDATVSLTRCLVQGGATTGQFNGGAVTVTDSALIGFPDAGPEFSDDDNDGIYFTAGTHRLVDSVFGWVRDDCVDAGSGSAGTVAVERCWFEASFHEAMAWSGAGRLATVADTVVVNCGQGIEAGWTTSGSVGGGTPETPDVRASGCLVLGGGTGLRFGDNYDWGYNGFLEVRDSIVLHNRRDIFGRDWTSWEENLDRMDIRGNRLTAADPNHPDNAVWDPATDAALLDPFMAVPGSVVGVGFAEWATQRPRASFGEPLTVGLSSFTSRTVSVGFVVLADGELAESGTVVIEPGATVGQITPDPGTIPEDARAVVVALTETMGGEPTGAGAVAYLAGAGGDAGIVLVPAGADWRFDDSRTDLGSAWRDLAFDDSTWDSGPAPLGFGDGDEATVIDGGPSGDRTPTIYFRHAFTVPDGLDPASIHLRLLRDDGASVHLNGAELVRSNLPSGTIGFATFAASTTSDENAFREFPDLPAGALVPGTNVLAVEVHQADADSSDLGFDLELAVVPASPPVLELVTTPDGGAWFVWTGEGWEAEWSADLGTGGWNPIDADASPLRVLRTGGDASAPPPDPGRAFFRLRRR